MDRRERDLLDRPLFGAPTSVDRVLNLVVAVLTGLMVMVTLISALVFPQWPPNGINVFFGLVIVLICASHLVLIYWYRQGDLEPRFRPMIFYNAFTVVLLCVVGNCYIHGVAQSTS